MRKRQKEEKDTNCKLYSDKKEMNNLITGAWREYEEYREIIEKMGHECVFMQNESDKLPCEPEWVEGVICNNLFGSYDIREFTNLRYIQLVSMGFDRVPIDYIQEKGMEIHSAKGVYAVPIAEYVVSMLLDTYRNPEFFSGNQKKKAWEKNRDIQELFGKKVIIIGCGSIGGEVAKRLSAFGCHITGIARSERKEAYFDRVTTQNGLDEALEASDIVVIAVPHTGETENLIDARRLSLMREGAILVNIARGAVLEEEAIPQYGRHLGKVILDVFKEEPLPEDSPLWDMDNVVITPHNSFVGEGNGRRLAECVIGNLKRCKV